MSILSEPQTISGTTSPARELTADSQLSGGGFTAVNGARMNGLKRENGHVVVSGSGNGEHANSNSNGNGNSNSNGNGHGVVHSPDGGYRSATNSPPESPGEKRKRTPSDTDESEENSPKRRMSPHGDLQAAPGSAGSGHGYATGPDGEAKDPSWYQQRDESEVRLAEALQREAHEGSSQGQNDYQPIRSSTDRGVESSQKPAEYNGTITTAAGVQVDPKKRKRVCSFFLVFEPPPLPLALFLCLSVRDFPDDFCKRTHPALYL